MTPTPTQQRIYETWRRFLEELPNRDNEIRPRDLPDGLEWEVKEIVKEVKA
jgi:hypothetical protein